MTNITLFYKKVDVGLAADLGTLQRLPKICGNDSIIRELAFTARIFGAEEVYLGSMLEIRDSEKSFNWFNRRPECLV